MTRRDDNVPSLVDRLRAQIESCQSGLDEKWDFTITGYSVALANRGRGPGLVLIASTVDGIGFEEPILPGDSVPASIGEAVH